MTIKTIEQYRASMRKPNKQTPKSQGIYTKYFITGFRSAAKTTLDKESNTIKNKK